MSAQFNETPKLSLLIALIVASVSKVVICSNQEDWSVDVSSLTTLPPPAKLASMNNLLNITPRRQLAETGHHRQEAASYQQDSLFDDNQDLPSFKLNRSTTGASQHSLADTLDSFNLSGALLNNSSNDQRWIPTTAMSNTINSYQLQPPTFQNQMISTERHPYHLKVLPMPGTMNVDLAKRLPLTSYAIPIDLLQRALTIQRSRTIDPSLITQLRPFYTLTSTPSPIRSSAKSVLSASTRLFGSKTDSGIGQKINIKRASKVREDPLLFSSIGLDSDRQPVVSTIARDDLSETPGLGMEFHQLASTQLSNQALQRSYEQESRSTKLDQANNQAEQDHYDNSLNGASSKYIPYYMNGAYISYPAHHKHLIAASRHGHEKGLTTPILVGIAAALISFLIISNLFLSIPLLAMTLHSFFSGNMMMMMMPNGNNNMQPIPQPSNPSNNGQQTAQGRRKKRWVTDEQWSSSLEEFILGAINKSFE